jgi:hypothetical protein
VGGLGTFTFVHLSIPPAHRGGAQLRRDLAFALAAVLVLAVLGSVAFSFAQSWRRRQDVLFPRQGKAWLPLALGAAFPAGFLLSLQAAQVVLRLDDPWWLLWILGLGFPVLLSRLAWRSTQPETEA